MALTLKAFKFVRRKDKKKHLLSIVPFLCTFSNAIFGFLAMISAIENNFTLSAYCILGAIIMDACDGRLARALNSCSYLGFELDSLCDAVSFCIAPAILLYQWSLNRMGMPGLAVLILYVSCGLLRLARFNVDTRNTYYFKGLPTTMAAFFITTFILYDEWILRSPLTWIIQSNYLLLIIALVSWLMISPLPFPSYKKNTRAFNVVCMVTSIITIVCTLQGYPFLFLGSTAYIGNGIIGSLIMYSKRFQVLKFSDQ